MLLVGLRTSFHRNERALGIRTASDERLVRPEGSYTSPERGSKFHNPEAINVDLQTGNQMALHTLPVPGCQHSTSLAQTGVNDGLDCSTAVGFIVHESTPNSSGAGHNDMGGDVWAIQFDVNGIQYVSLVL